MKICQGDYIDLSLHVKIALTNKDVSNATTVLIVALLSTMLEAGENGSHGETGGSCMYGTKCSCE